MLHDIKDVIHNPQQARFDKRRLKRLAPKLFNICRYLADPGNFPEACFPQDIKHEVITLLSQIQGQTKQTSEAAILTQSISKPSTRSIYIKWTIEDVKLVRPDLTDDQIGQVLDTMHYEHNPLPGLDLDTVNLICEKLYPS